MLLKQLQQDKEFYEANIEMMKDMMEKQNRLIE